MEIIDEKKSEILRKENEVLQKKNEAIKKRNDALEKRKEASQKTKEEAALLEDEAKKLDNEANSLMEDSFDQELLVASLSRDLASMLKDKASQLKNELSSEDKSDRKKRKKGKTDEGIEIQNRQDEAHKLEDEAQDFDSKADELEKEVFNGNEEGRKRYREALKLYKAAQEKNILSQNRDEATTKTEERLTQRTNTIKTLKRYRGTIRTKQWLLVIPTIVVIFTIVFIVGVLCSDKLSEAILRLDNNLVGKAIQKIAKLVLDYAKGTSGTIALLLMLFLMFYITCHVIKSFRRNQKALHKLNLIIIRLELYTDKDLVISSRLDRELEMINRILES